MSQPFVPGTSRRLTARTVLAGLALVGAAAAVALAHEGHAALPTKGAAVDLAHGQVALSAASREALDVETVEVQARRVEERVLAYATLVPPWGRHSFASTRLGGTVDRVLVKPGQVVAAGEVLAEVRSPEVETLRGELRTARTEADLAAQVVSQLRAGGAGLAVPERTVLEAEAKERQAANALAVTRVKWRALGLPESSLAAVEAGTEVGSPVIPVRSPIAGTVIHADVAAGRVVDPTEHLFEVMDLAAVWARVGVAEHDLYRVAAGQEVELQLVSFPGEVFRGTVRAVDPAIDPVTHLTTVWAEFTNPPAAPPRLLPGMTGRAFVVVTPPGPRPAVPAGAVFGEGAERFVLVEEASAAGASEYRRRPVAVGRETPEWAEVRAGEVFPGDRVVTRGGHELSGYFVAGVLRPGPEARTGMGLVVEPAGVHAVDDVLPLTGAVEVLPDRRGTASASLPGSLVNVRVVPGQAVAAGQVLAEVESLDLITVQLDLIRAGLEAALQSGTLGRLRAAGRAVPRRQVLETEGLVAAARNQADTARRKLLSYGLSAAAVEEVARTQKPVQAVPVRAPVAGVIAGFERTPGQVVRAEEPVFQVHDLSHPVVRGFVPEREAGVARVGQPVRVRLVADPGYEAAGTVTRTGRVVGGDDRTLSVWVDLPAPAAGRVLRHGQFARLSLVTGSSRETLAVPRSAIVEEGTRAFVFVEKTDGSFERRAVVTGRSDDRFVEVRDGLRNGEPVAVRGAIGLQTTFAVVR